MKTCPRNPKGHLRFRADAIESHEWEVNGHGHFIDDIATGDCHLADMTEFVCLECGATAVEVDL